MGKYAFNTCQESIDALQGNITLIIIAHRLTTIRNCDKIYLNDNGIIEEKRKEEVLGQDVLMRKDQYRVKRE